jgi:hypothetical protein
MIKVQDVICLTTLELSVELSVKLLKEGTRTPSLAKTGDKTQNWAWKKYKGVEQGAKLDFGTKTQGQMSLIPNLCLSPRFLCPKASLA